jgi:hypothetical protein
LRGLALFYLIMPFILSFIVHCHWRVKFSACPSVWLAVHCQASRASQKKSNPCDGYASFELLSRRLLLPPAGHYALDGFDPILATLMNIVPKLSFVNSGLIFFARRGWRRNWR